jgi:hypothetical protein
MLDVSVLYVLLLVDICVHGSSCLVHVVFFVYCHLIYMCGVVRCTSCTEFDVAQLPGCWLEVSIRKVLRPVISAQVFLLGFPVSKSKC